MGVTFLFYFFECIIVRYWAQMYYVADGVGTDIESINHDTFSGTLGDIRIQG
jgi:hypothetical protein